MSRQHPTESDPPEKDPMADVQPAVSDSDFKDAEIEERAILFWNRYRNVILTGLLTAFLLFVGYWVFKGIRASQEASVRAAYSQALENETLAEFVESHGSHPSAGSAALELAQAAYEEENYSEAATYFARASENLDGTPFGHQARIGHGLSELYAGNADEAEVVLRLAAENDAIFPGQRQQAWLHLAYLYWGQERYAEAREAITALEDLNPEREAQMALIDMAGGFNVWALAAQTLSDELDRQDSPDADAGL